MGFFYIHKISPYLHEAKGERNGGRHLSDVS